jgi:simple sugar transport system permease protein
VALAVVVFARWSPWGVLAGALLFGVVNALQFQFQATSIEAPYQLFLALPYVVTLAALLLPAGVARTPRALGARYERS